MCTVLSNIMASWGPPTSALQRRAGPGSLGARMTEMGFGRHHSAFGDDITDFGTWPDLVQDIICGTAHVLPLTMARWKCIQCGSPADFPTVGWGALPMRRSSSWPPQHRIRALHLHTSVRSLEDTVC